MYDGVPAAKRPLENSVLPLFLVGQDHGSPSVAGGLLCHEASIILLSSLHPVLFHLTMLIDPLQPQAR